MDIRQLKTRHLLAVVRFVDEAGIHDVAQRLQQRISAIMRYAVQYEIIDSNPALDMAGALSIPKAVHHPALPPARITELLSRISRYKGLKVTQLAVELHLLTFVRSSELRLACWNEINLERALWEIPAKREPIAGVRYSDRGMKMKFPHLSLLADRRLT